MYIIVNKQSKSIVATLVNVEIVDNKWVKSYYDSFILLDNVDIVEVESVPHDAIYYIDETFVSETEYDNLQKRPAYIERVKELVRVKYADADTELAILRKHLAGIGNNEFEYYNEYVEDCKARAKEELGI